MLRLALLGAGLGLALSAPAHAGLMHHVSPAATCPQGSSNPDGCVQAPAFGSIISPSMAAFAVANITDGGVNQAAAIANLTNRTNMGGINWPSIDYAIGPTTDKSLVSPATAVASLPCTLNATGGGGTPAGPLMTCTTVTGGSSHLRTVTLADGTVVSNALVFDHIDFGSGGTTTQLLINGATTVPIVFISNHIKTYADAVYDGGYDVKILSGVTVLRYWQSNEVDGNYPGYIPVNGGVYPTTSPGSNEIDDFPICGTACATWAEYNVIHDCRQRCWGEQNWGTATWKYNRGYNFVMAGQASAIAGSINATDINVTSLSGAIQIGSVLNTAAGVTATRFLSQTSGTQGGVGHYVGSVSQVVASFTGGLANGQHSEMVEYVVAQGTAGTMPLMLFSYNVESTSSATPSNPPSGTSLIYLQLNDTLSTITQGTMDTNLLINNSNIGPNATSTVTYSSAVANMGPATNVTFSRNFAYLNGTFQCFNFATNVTNPVIYTGNLSLDTMSALTGNAIGYGNTGCK